MCEKLTSILPSRFSFHLKDNVHKNTNLGSISQITAPEMKCLSFLNNMNHLCLLRMMSDKTRKPYIHTYLIWTKEINEMKHTWNGFLPSG